MSQVEFPIAVATPLKLECELTAVDSVPVAGLQAYDDGAGGAVVIHADTLDLDQQQAIAEVMAAHVAGSPPVDYLELIGVPVGEMPYVIARGIQNNVDAGFQAKGDGQIFLRGLTLVVENPSGQRIFEVIGQDDGFGISVNYLALISKSAGTYPQLLAVGPDIDLGVNIVTTGAGHLQENGVAVGLTGNPLSQFAATTSAQLAGVISNETGSGALVFATSPTLVTPLLGTPTSGVLTNCTGLPTAGLLDASVTLAKMANLAQDQFIGRVTASTGVPETATITAAARTVLDDTTVSAMVDTLGGASATGTGGLVRLSAPTLTGNTTVATINKLTLTAPATAATLTLIDGTTLTGPAASGTAMTLGNAETITAVKTFGTTTKLDFTDGNAYIQATSSGVLSVQGATTTSIGTISGTVLIGNSANVSFGNGSADVLVTPNGDGKAHLGDATYGYTGLNLSCFAARSITMNRQSVANLAGLDLNIYAGGATVGATNKGGGNLNLVAGQTTGTGTSKINFYTGPSGASGTGDNDPFASLVLSSTQAAFGEAVDFVFGTTTGTKIGTSTTQKLAFYNSTPIVKPSAYTQTYSTADKTHANATGAAVAGSVVAGGTGAAAGGWDTAAHRDTTITTIGEMKTSINGAIVDLADLKQLVNSVIDDLQALGLVA